MVTTTIQLSAANVGGLLIGPSGPIQVPANGLITANLNDVSDLLRAGCTYVNNASRYMAFNIAPAVATAGKTVNSTALANGTLSIAAQPDVPRVLGIRIDPGTSALTAGNVAVNYVANDGTTVTDNIAAATAASTYFTTDTSRGAVLVNSVIVTGVAGGASPKVQVDTTNQLAVQVDPGFANFTLLRSNVDGANDTTATAYASAGAYIPGTAPNGTHTFSANYIYNAPNS
jgi:hypothetical protein